MGTGAVARKSQTMRMNRRNVLVGLGTIVAGGGAALGTGAFSTVSADRTVSISAAGDGSALLSINVTGAIAGSNGDTIQFELGNGVNLDATTRFNGSLTITNNGSKSVDIDITDGNGDSMIDGTSSSDMSFEPSTSGAHTGVASGGGSVSFDIVFDLTGTTTAGNESIPSAVTISATDSNA